jgi:hypothetical protein
VALLVRDGAVAAVLAVEASFGEEVAADMAFFALLGRVS